MERQQEAIPTFTSPDPESLFLASEHGLRTYRDLNRYKDFFLKHLSDSNADLDKPVGFAVPSCDSLIFAIASCWTLGIPFVCFNPDATSFELKKQFEKLKPGAVIIGQNKQDEFGDTVQIPIREIEIEEALSGEKKKDSKQKGYKPRTDPDDIFGYFFTSGTSGFPKIVPLKRRQMLFGAHASAENFRPAKDHFWLLCLPPNHIGGVSIILRSVLYGSGIYRMNKFDEQMVTTFLSENPLFHAASLVPTMLKRLIKIPAFQTHKNFKAILLGGGPIDPSLLEQSVRKGIPLVSSYGMTETCAQIAANPLLEPSGVYPPLKSVGYIFPPNKIEIRDESGRKLGPNNPGSIWLKGPQVFDGYLNPELNKQMFDEDGWYSTGDSGRLNANEQLFIESRRSDLIITGGENVSPYEVETELEKLEQIAEAAVLGLPDEEWGQKVVAVVVSGSDKKISAEEIRKQLKDRISSFKIPKEILQTDSLPKSRSGKIIRRKLLKLFE